MDFSLFWGRSNLKSQCDLLCQKVTLINQKHPALPALLAPDFRCEKCGKCGMFFCLFY